MGEWADKFQRDFKAIASVMCNISTTNCGKLLNTRPPYLPPEKSVCRSKCIAITRHGTTDWFKIGEGVWQGCILSPGLFNLYTKYIMWNARLHESQAGIRIARRNINNLRCVNDTTLMAENEEKLKSFLISLKKESEKVGLKLMASGPITSWQIEGGKVEVVTNFTFLGS